MLLKVLDREEMALQLKNEEVVAAHKKRVASLEQTLQYAQGKHLKRVREKLDNNIESRPSRWRCVAGRSQTCVTRAAHSHNHKARQRPSCCGVCTWRQFAS